MPLISPLLTPTSDLFIASLWSAPSNEHILRSLINSVMTDAGLPPIVKATVRNPINIQEYSADKRIILDVRVEDESGTFYNVEVQRDADASFLGSASNLLNEYIPSEAVSIDGESDGNFVHQQRLGKTNPLPHQSTTPCP